MRLMSLLVLVALTALGCKTEGPAEAPVSSPTKAPTSAPASAPDSAPSKHPSTGPLTGKTDDGTWDVTVEFIPDNSPKMGSLFSVETQVKKSGTDELVEGATVSVDAGMPAHQHGMVTEPKHRELGDGKYRSDGMKLHMSGEWLFEVVVEKDGSKETAKLWFNQSPVTNTP